MTDEPIRLPLSKEQYQRPSINVNIWIPQDHLDGIHALMQWLDGYESAKSGNIPGHFELIMHFRELKNKINEQLREKE